MKKTVFVITCFIAIALLSMAFIKQEDPLYKNLKILPKDITKHGMDSIMKHYTVSLGVKCNFCHVRNEADRKLDFASDGNKKKAVAREMMLMTREINRKYFVEQNWTNEGDNSTDQAITCYTCHHGQEDPAAFPPPRTDTTHEGATSGSATHSGPTQEGTR